MTQFQKELLSLLNRHSQENESDTPDFILAEYLIGSLKVFNESVNNRQIWYGRKKKGESELENKLKSHE